MQPNKKKSVSVKDKLEGNELDLSLMELTEVPVKEMAAVPRGTVVDLSNNSLVSLPMTFPTLVHIVKLDLSKNQLTSLPPNFGDLRNLKHLDLYSNKLERVPVSFYQLKELRWLDLKSNPLVPTLAEAAGNCLDTKECHEAAKKVVKLMAMVHSELERKRIQDLEEEKARQQAQKAKADKEKEVIRLQKKASKEKKKTEAAAKQNTQNTKSSEIKTIDNELQAASKVNQFNSRTNNERQQTASQGNTSSSWCRSFFHMMLRLLTLAVVFATAVLALHWEGPFTYENLIVVSDRAYDNTYRFSIEIIEWSQPHLERMKEQWKHLSRFVAENGRDIMSIAWLKIVHWAGFLQDQSFVLFAVLRERGSEWLTLGGVHAARAWDVVCEQAPIYYHIALNKIQELYNSTIALARN